ncbi:MAG: N-acetylneuraminate lyase [Clostridia bacterium]|nr:N-acetylneuraminate lyase [Clostridia bacterium]
MTDVNKFKGIFPALLTPFNEKDEINEKALEKLIEYNIQKGVTGFYVGGSTAEAFLLSDEERLQVYRLVKEIVGKRCTLIAHIGCISTGQTIMFGECVQSLGYDAVSAVAPFYYKFTFDEIKKHYFDVVEHIDLPMLIYNFPAFSGVNLTTENLKLFLNDERFIGVKHTSNDYFGLEQFKTAFPHKVFYNGFDEMFLAGLSMGADGGIGSTYNFMAEKFIKMQQLFNEEKHSEAFEIQQIANKIIAALIKVGVFQGEKAVLNMLGFDFGDVRAPFEKISKENYDYIEKTVIPLL